MINFEGLLLANMETNNSRNQNSVGQSNNYNHQNHQSSAPRNNFNKQRPNTRFQQPVGRETYLFDSQPSHYPNPSFPPFPNFGTIAQPLRQKHIKVSLKILFFGRIFTKRRLTSCVLVSPRLLFGLSWFQPWIFIIYWCMQLRNRLSSFTNTRWCWKTDCLR